MSLNSSALNTRALNTLAGTVQLHGFNITQEVLPVAYFYRFFVTNRVTQDYAHTLNVTQDVTSDIYVFSFSIANEVNGTSSFSIPILQDVLVVYNGDGTVNLDPPSETYDPEELQDLSNIYPSGGYVNAVALTAGDSYSWSLIVLVGGIDVSFMLSGPLTVNREANQAAICSFDLLDVDLTEAAVNSWNQKTLDVTYVQGSYSKKIFKGGIAGFTYDPILGQFSFTAADNLQRKVQDMYGAGSIPLPAGHEFKDVSSPEGANGWDWFASAMETVSLDFGLTSSGVFVFSSWFTGAEINYTFNENSIVDGTLSLTLQDKEQLINYVEVIVTESYKELGASSKSDSRTRFFRSNKDTHQIIVRCNQSLDAVGVKRAYANYQVTADYSNALELWTKTKTTTTDTDEKVAYLSSKEMHDLVLGSKGEDVSGSLYSCPSDVTGKTDPFTVKVAAFYASSGVAGTVISSRTEATVEPDPCAISNLIYPAGYSSGAAAVETISVTDADGAVLAGNHADAERKKQDAINIAIKKILATHRGTVTSFTSLIMPDLLWGHSIKVSTDNLLVQGRVSSVTHVLDVLKGKASSNIVMKTLDSGRDEGLAPTVVVNNHLPSTLNCDNTGSTSVLSSSSKTSSSFATKYVTIPNNLVQIGQY